MKIVLNDDVQALLRKKGLMTEFEIAYRFGDIVIVEHSLDGTKRQLTDVPSYVTETNSKSGLLKG
jgi:hypothetical protein